MTVENTSSKNAIVTGGFAVGATISITFPFEKEDTVMIETEQLGKLVYGSDYEVDENNVVLKKAIATDDKVQVYRKTDLTQERDIPQNAKFNSISLEEALDKLTLQNQEQEEVLDRCLKVETFAEVTPEDMTKAVYDVSMNMSDINAAVANIENIKKVAANETDISTVADDIANVNSVGNSIENVDTAARNISDIKKVAANETNISTVADGMSHVEAVATDIQSVRTVSANRTDVATVANKISNVNTVAGNMSAVTTVNAGLSTITAVNENKTNIDNVVNKLTEIESVLDNMAAVNTVSTNISNVNAVGKNIKNVNSVANNEQHINTVVTNLSDIQLASQSREAITNVANGLLNIGIVADNLEGINIVGADIYNINTCAIYIEDIKNAPEAATTAQEAATTAQGAASSIKNSADTIAANTSAIATNTSAIGTLEEGLQTANTNIATNTSAIDTLEEGLQTANTNIATNTSDIEKLRKQGSAAYTRFAVNQANTTEFGPYIQLLDFTMGEVAYIGWAAAQIGFKIGGEYPTLKVTNAQGTTIEVTTAPTPLNPANYYHDRDENEWSPDILYINETGFHVIPSCRLYITNSSRHIADQLNDGDKNGIVLCTASEPIKAYHVTKGQNGAVNTVEEFDGVPLCGFVVERQADEEGNYHYGFINIEESILECIGYNGYDFNTNILPYGWVSNVQNTVLKVNSKNLQFDKIDVNLGSATYFGEYKGLFDFELETSMNEEITVYFHTRAYQEEFSEEDGLKKQCIGRTSGGILKTTFTADILTYDVTMYFETDSGAKAYLDKVRLTLLTVQPQHYRGYGFIYNPGAEEITSDGTINYTVKYTESDTAPYTHNACLFPVNSSEADVLADAGVITIDWGDGTTTELSGTDLNWVVIEQLQDESVTYSARPSHTYAGAGEYTVSISTSGNPVYMKPCFQNYPTLVEVAGSSTLVKWEEPAPLHNVVSINSTPMFFMCCFSPTEFPDLNIKDNRSGYIFGAENCQDLQSIPRGILSNPKWVGPFSWGLTHSENPFIQCFSGCTGLETIPDDLFGGYSDQVTVIGGLFQDTNLHTIPEGLLNRCTSLVECMDHAFGSELISLPSELFARSGTLQFLYNLFSYNSNLTSIPSTLLNPDIFDLGRGVLSFADMFSSCSSLVLSADLFGGDLSFFSGIGEGSGSIDFSGMFRLFAQYSGGAKGTAPALWNIEVPSGVSINCNGCFYGHSTESLTNYGDIPENWRT